MAARGMRTAAKPAHLSTISRGVDLSAAEVGAGMLGLDLTPQGRLIAGVLESRVTRRGVERARYSDVAVQVPRRATKTTSVWSVLIGRAMTRPGYRCVTTAQSGTIASSIIVGFGDVLERRGYGGYEPRGRIGGSTVNGDRTLRLLRNGGRERLEFANGSAIWVVPPDPGAVRSAAADDIVVDEAGELEGAKGTDFLAGVRPLQDTRGPLAQLIIAGTPGKSRAGMFWDVLTEARAGTDAEQGIVDYSARDDDDPDDERTWRRFHPGIGTVTTLEVIRKRRAKMSQADFAREYLCVWPTDASTGALDVAGWAACGVEEFPERPARFALSFEAPKDLSCAAVMAAWRLEDGRACLEVLAFRPGISWVAGFVHRVARETRSPVVYDEIGGNVAIGAELRRLRPAVRVLPVSMRHVGGAAQLVADVIRERRVVHACQPDLTGAVEGVGWRPMGRDSRAFVQRPGMADKSPIVAGSLALWHWDEARLGSRTPIEIVVAS